MDPLSLNSMQAGGPQWQGQADASKLQALQRQTLNPEGKSHAKLKKAAQDFEAIFIQQMLEAMDQTIDREGSFINGGNSEHYFRSMMNEEIAKSMANRTGGSGFGLAESIYQQMAKNLKAEAPQSATSIPVQGTNGEVTP